MNDQRIPGGLLAVRALAGFLAAVFVHAQTTQGLVSGTVRDRRTDLAIAGASIKYTNHGTGEEGETSSGATGFFVLPLLSPGIYRITASAGNYQSQAVDELELRVAARLQVEFALRPVYDLWEKESHRFTYTQQERVVNLYATDVETLKAAHVPLLDSQSSALHASVSYVVERREIDALPLPNRDVYTVLAFQPAVTADASTARGLGLSSNGQRPTSSNFLLDGVENNNYLITGPLLPLAPEQVQEYRITTNNYSAEFGRTGGFIANAVTRGGTSDWHGLAYGYLKNELLNANEFGRNARSFSRTPLKELLAGFFTGGPIVPQRLFVSGAFERLRYRSRQQPLNVVLPTASFINSLSNALIRGLFDEFSAPAGSSSNQQVQMEPSTTLDRSTALSRLDYVPRVLTGKVTGRIAFARVERPDLLWSPYPRFSTPMEDRTVGAALAWTLSRGSTTYEVRGGYAFDNLTFDRPEPEVPILQSFDRTDLPGSGALYSFHNRTHGAEGTFNATWMRGRHVIKAGGGLLLRFLNGYLTLGRDGILTFENLFRFAENKPNLAIAGRHREELPLSPEPDYNRRYRVRQFYVFLQDSFRPTRRLTFDVGFRYENVGTPQNTGATKDSFLDISGTGSFEDRLKTAELLVPPAGSQRLYDADNNDAAARFGISFLIPRLRHTLLRAAYGVFYDRPFDNLWQTLRNNNVALYSFAPSIGLPFVEALEAYESKSASPLTNASRPFLFQPGIRSSYVHSFFAGVQREILGSLFVEVNLLGSLGRKLLTTDVVNREYSDYRPRYPRIYYRANQGHSDYYAMTLSARYRSSRSQLHASYTWGHAIDIQSDPLTGEFVDFNQFRGTDEQRYSVFSQQFDSRGERGNADFDQRHNLVFHSIWEPGGWLRNWRFSQLAAFRSGFPFTVIANKQDVTRQLLLPRADQIQPQRTPMGSDPVGGTRLLDRTAFAAARPDQQGNTGRNAFSGPGLYNIDVSVSRFFSLPGTETARMTVRADIFNVLNHANLNNPESVLGHPDFGVALYGRKGRSTGFPTLTPFDETARRIQLMLRIEF